MEVETDEKQRRYDQDGEPDRRSIIVHGQFGRSNSGCDGAPVVGAIAASFLGVLNAGPGIFR